MSRVGPRLPRSFFARDPDIVARDLIGRVLVVPVGQGIAATDPGSGATSGSDVIPVSTADHKAADHTSHHTAEPILLQLTETEAYHGERDPASHAFRGRTPRTAVMFGPPGFLYTYFVYGMHWCANIVTGVDGEASAVLLRAAMPIGNLAALRERRRTPSGTVLRDTVIASGPARLASCIGLGRADSGVDLLASDAPFSVHAGDVTDRQRPAIAAGPRVGVAAGIETPWRFYEVDHPTVTSYRRGGRRR